VLDAANWPSRRAASGGPERLSIGSIRTASNIGPKPSRTHDVPGLVKLRNRFDATRYVIRGWDRELGTTSDLFDLSNPHLNLALVLMAN